MFFWEPAYIYEIHQIFHMKTILFTTCSSCKIIFLGDEEIPLSIDLLDAATSFPVSVEYAEVSSDKVLTVTCTNHHTAHDGTATTQVFVEQDISGSCLNAMP